MQAQELCAELLPELLDVVGPRSVGGRVEKLDVELGGERTNVRVVVRRPIVPYEDQVHAGPVRLAELAEELQLSSNTGRTACHANHPALDRVQRADDPPPGVGSGCLRRRRLHASAAPLLVPLPARRRPAVVAHLVTKEDAYVQRIAA